MQDYNKIFQENEYNEKTLITYSKYWIEAQKRITITFNENESDNPNTDSIPAAIIGVPSPIDVPVDPNNPTMNRTSIIWPGTPSACLPNNPLQLLLILSRGILFT